MLALFCALGLVSSTPWANAATVAEIAKNPAAFDQKTVTVSGTAGEFSSRTSRRGNPYTTFRLSDQGEALKVFSFGTPAVKDGERVEVRGIFQRVKHVGAYTFHDEIDASSVSPAKQVGEGRALLRAEEYVDEIAKLRADLAAGGLIEPMTCH
jgi:hypothetical protein